MSARKLERLRRNNETGVTAVASAAVTLGAIHQILIEKQFTGTKANAVQRTTAQFHPSPFNHMDELHRFTGIEQQLRRWEGSGDPPQAGPGSVPEESAELRADKATTWDWLQYPALIRWRPSAMAEPWMDKSRLTSSCDPAPADALQHRCSAEPEAWGNGGSSGDRPSDPPARHAPPTGAVGTTPSHLPAGCSTDNCDNRSWWPNKCPVNAFKLVTVYETDYGKGQISGFPSGS